jgi:hypothetical protein
MLDTWRYGAAIRYAFTWGDPNVLDYGISLAPEYQWTVYRFDPLTTARRRDGRIDVTAQFWARFDRRFRVMLEFRHLDSDSNFLSARRLPDNRFGVTTQWLF